MKAGHACLDENRALAYLAGGDPAIDRDGIDEHLDGCATCRLLVRQLAAAGVEREPRTVDLRGGNPAPAPMPRGGAVEIGDQIGRYRIDERIGRGGMGEVFRAWDPDLQRDVAIKLVAGEHAGTAGEARLIAEARALARLSHPNVVAVHDVGAVDRAAGAGGGVFIAMELVAGDNLRTWLETKRTADEIIAVFDDVAAGLAAAHAAGVVHRDLKPDNVVVGERVVVVDFGLASVESAAGTPRYMAPEVLAGEAGDERADQFALAVSMWEALAGKPPFAGSTLDELRAQTASGPPRPPASIPVHLRKPLVRALSVDAGDRFGSIDALVAATRPRSQRLVAGGIALLGIALAGVAVTALAAGGDPCASMGPRVDSVWNPLVRVELAAAIAGTGRGHAADTAAALARRFDDHAAALASTHRRTCSARGERSTALVDRQLACLDRALDDWRAQLALMIDAPSPELADRALAIADQLADLERCESAAFADVEPEPADRADRIAALRERVTAARAQYRAGRFAAVAAELGALESEASAIGYGPLSAEVKVLAGDNAAAIGDFAGARDAYYAAAELAGEARDEHRHAEALIELVGVVGYQRAEIDGGLNLARLAEAALARAGDPPKLRGALDRNLAATYLTARRWDDSIRHARAALEGVEALRGPDHADTASMLNNLAAPLAQRGELDEAIELMERALAVAERARGAEHPELARLRINLCAVFVRLGKLGDAAAHCERARAIWDASMPANHPHNATVHAGQGNLARARGDRASAKAHFDAAIAILRAAETPSRADLATVLVDRGKLALDLSDAATARATLSEALELTIGLEGEDNLRTASVRHFVGRAMHQAGDFEKAAALQRQVLETRLELAGEGTEPVAEARSHLGMALVNLGSTASVAEARRLFDRALADYRRLFGGDHPDVGETLNRIGTAMVYAGETKDAVGYFEQYLAIAEKHAKGDEVGFALNNLGEVLKQSRDFLGAAAYYRRAVDRLRASGADRPEPGVPLLNLGEVAFATGDNREALRRYREALALWDRTVDRGHPYRAYALVGVGKVELRRKKLDDAIAALSEAAAIAESRPADPALLGQARLLWAKALDRRGEREKALELARAARPELVKAGARTAAEVKALDAWIAARQ